MYLIVWAVGSCYAIGEEQRPLISMSLTLVLKGYGQISMVGWVPEVLRIITTVFAKLYLCLSVYHKMGNIQKALTDPSFSVCSAFAVMTSCGGL